jgi:Tol biopolymer transport system component
MGIYLVSPGLTYMNFPFEQFLPAAQSPTSVSMVTVVQPTMVPTLQPTETPTPNPTATPTPLPTDTPAPTSTPSGGSNRIVFVSDRTFNSEIFLTNTDGSELVNLSRDLGYDGWPIWSSDGSQLLFTSSRDSDCKPKDICTNIYILDVVTGAVEQLTLYERAVAVPEAWLPDGRVAFNMGVVPPTPAATLDVGLYIVSRDGYNATLLQDLAGWEWLKELEGGLSPRWSPDGSQVLVCWFNPATGTSDMILANADGSDPHSVIPANLNTGEISQAAWSPDGRWIAFVHASGSGGDLKQVIYVMRPGGGNLRVLTDVGLNANPSWSPDGSQIVFASNRDGNWELYIVNSDGSGVVRFTTYNENDVQPAWAPR